MAGASERQGTGFRGDVSSAEQQPLEEQQDAITSRRHPSSWSKNVLYRTTAIWRVETVQYPPLRVRSGERPCWG